jgi:hypothetical protein
VGNIVTPTNYYQMKVFILVTFILFHQTLFSQNLVGNWRGYYAYNYANSDVAIALQIELNTDSSLNIHSYTLLKEYFEKDSIWVCKVIVLKNKDNILDLEEIDPVTPNRAGLQIMHLAYKKKGDFEYLQGTWKSGTWGPDGKGRIRFVKLKND